MKTLTVTAARQNLGRWLKRAAQGEDIGVVVDGRIVAFRPVEVYSDDCAEIEYGVSREELDRFASSVREELEADRRAGRMKSFTGKLARERSRRSS